SALYIFFHVSFCFLSILPLFRPWFFFFFHDTSPTQIYTLSLHDALPISVVTPRKCPGRFAPHKRSPRCSTSTQVKVSWGYISATEGANSKSASCWVSKSASCSKVRG